MSEKEPIIFVAIPTKGTVSNRRINREVLERIARLQEQHPNTTFIAPMVQDYQLLEFMDPAIETTWKNWGAHCRTLIQVSDEIWVLKYNGWDTSIGVTAEIEHGMKHGKIVRFVDVTKV